MQEAIEKALSTLGIELEDTDTIEFQEIIPGITPPKIPLLIPGLEKLPLLPGWTIRDPGGKVLNQGAHISLNGDGKTPEPPIVHRSKVFERTRADNVRHTFIYCKIRDGIVKSKRR